MLVFREEEHYMWEKVTTHVHDFGKSSKQWVNHAGKVTIKNTSKDLTCELSYVKVGLSFMFYFDFLEVIFKCGTSE